MGRAREAQAEVDALKQLGAGVAEVLAEFAARCDATPPATEAQALLGAVSGRVTPDGTKYLVPTRCTTRSDRERVASAWAERVRRELDVVAADGWTTQVSRESPPDGEAGSGESTHGIDVLEGSRLRGRVRLGWDASNPGALAVGATSDGAPRVATAVGRLARFLGLVGAVLVFGSWVWFCIEDAGRVWNRIKSFGGPGPDRASKLEIGWMAVGWAVGPVFVFIGFSALAGWFDGIAARARTRSLARFARRELDARVGEVVERIAADADPSVRAQLGR